MTGDVEVRVTATDGVVDHRDIDGDGFVAALADCLPGSVMETVPPFDAFSLRYDESERVTVDPVPRDELFDPAVNGCRSGGIGA